MRALWLVGVLCLIVFGLFVGAVVYALKRQSGILHEIVELSQFDDNGRKLDFKNKSKRELTLAYKESLDECRSSSEESVLPFATTSLDVYADETDKARYHVYVSQVDEKGITRQSSLNWSGKPKGTILAYTPQGKIVWLNVK
jgi:hypothetical protein